MDNNTKNLILIFQNQLIQRNHETNNNINKLIFITTICIFIVPFILFFIKNKNQFVPEYSFQNENNDYQFFNIANNDNIENINYKIRKLDNNKTSQEIHINFQQQDEKNISEFLMNEAQKILNIYLEKLSSSIKALNELTSNNDQKNLNELFFLGNNKDLAVSKMPGCFYKGNWEYYPFVSSNIKNETNFEYFYYSNFAEIDDIFYRNSSNKIFTVGKETNGTAIINFKKLYNKTTLKEMVGIFIKNLEGNFVDNWIQHISFTPFSNITKIIDEKRNKYYIRGIFTTLLSKGKILTNQNLFKNSKKCQTLIEAEFPTSQINVSVSYANKNPETKIVQIINTHNFSMILSSQCGFRFKIDAIKYNLNEYNKEPGIKKEIIKFFWINITISILYLLFSNFTIYELDEHQDTIDTFNVFFVSQIIAWHSYRLISDIYLGFNFPSFFFRYFTIMSLFHLINILVSDLRLLQLFWKIKKRNLSNRQFFIFRFKIYVYFYYFFIFSFFFIGSFYYEKKLIWISVIFLWTPQIIHNIINYNKFIFPFIYIILTTIDRLINPFYFRWNNNNFLNVRGDPYFLKCIIGYVMMTVIILYLQVFLGPRFMLTKRFKRKTINFHKNKSEILKEKPDSINEECIICLCPLFNENIINTEKNNDSYDNNEIENKKNNEKIKPVNRLKNKIYNNSEDINTENHMNIKSEIILDIANKKRIKSLTKKKLFKNKVNPIIINRLYIGKKTKAEKGIKERYFLIKIFSIIKGILLHNLLFFYKYVPNSKNKKYMLLTCGHVFHSQCLEKWLAIKKECPSCRASINE